MTHPLLLITKPTKFCVPLSLHCQENNICSTLKLGGCANPRRPCGCSSRSLFIYFIYTSVYLIILHSWFTPLLSPWVITNLFSMPVGLLLFYKQGHLHHFMDYTDKWWYICLCLTYSTSMMISRVMNVACWIFFNESTQTFNSTIG